MSNSEKNLNLNLVKHSGKSSSANNCSGSNNNPKGSFFSIANQNINNSSATTQSGGNGSNTNNLNTPSTSHTDYQQHMLSDSNENSIRNSPIYNGSKNIVHQQLQQQHSSGRSSAVKNPLISSCQGSFHSLQGENTPAQYGSSLSSTGTTHQHQHQQAANIIHHHQQHRQSSSTTESLNGSGTLVFSRSRVNSNSDSTNNKHSNFNKLNYDKKCASSGANINNNNHQHNTNSSTRNKSNNNNSSGTSNDNNKNNSELKHIIELNKQVHQLNSKNIEFNRQLSAPTENHTATSNQKDNPNSYSNSVYNLSYNNHHILNQYHSGSPNTNSLNRTKKKRSFKLNGR